MPNTRLVILLKSLQALSAWCLIKQPSIRSKTKLYFLTDVVEQLKSILGVQQFFQRSPHFVSEILVFTGPWA